MSQKHESGDPSEADFLDAIFREENFGLIADADSGHLASGVVSEGDGVVGAKVPQPRPLGPAPQPPPPPPEPKSSTFQDALEILHPSDLQANLTNEDSCAAVPSHFAPPKEVGTKQSRSKRVAYSVSCVLCISGSDYQVQLLPMSSHYEKAYRLNKIDAQKPTGYNVTQVNGAIICECSDFKYRQGGAETKGCKHVKALIDMGMFGMSSVSYRQGSGVLDI